MTQAVCLQCGASKFGAWVPCPNCGFTPEDSESMTKHLLVSSHFLKAEEIEEVARKVKSGETVEFDPEKLEAFKVDPEQTQKDIERMQKGCNIVVFVLLLVAGLIIWQAWS